MPVDSRYHPSTAYLELGPGYADEVEPAKFPELKLRFRNQGWAEKLGLGGLSDDEWRQYFAEFTSLPKNLPTPLALRYHGHQFRSYNPDLGDGRGFLFAQLTELRTGRLLDLGTKGSGQTPYSRNGDGRLTLKGAVREALATEMLESLGVNTSKTFSFFETGESLHRGDEPSPTRAAVLVRLNHSHIRFGTFQRLRVLGDDERMRRLVAYALKNYFSVASVEADQAAAFFREATERSAELAADWMIAGFVHGVLNTDNMNITGESFDYGPYRFLPTYDPAFTAAYFDHTGLYAYGRQPESVLWSLEQLASSLLPLTQEESLVEALESFSPRFNLAAVTRVLGRLGLKSAGQAKDEELLVALFAFLKAAQPGFEQFFHDWYGGALSTERASRSPEAEKYRGETFASLSQAMNAHSAADGVRERLNDPYFARAKPCALLIDEIESIWEAIADNDDWSRFEKKIEDIRLMGVVHSRREP